MKKIKIFILSFFVLCASAFAEEDIVSFSIGLSSGVPFYGSNTIAKTINDTSNNNRIIIGSLASINFNIADAITFFGGTDFSADFNWNNDKRCNIFAWDFSAGLKVYPGLGGLDFGLAYVLGYEACYAGVKNGNTQRDVSAWGNGFKFLMEYNFAHSGNSKFLPTVGLFWKRIPRGEYTYDNQLTAYICANL